MVSWFRLQYPHYIIAAIPNGGQRSALEAKIMKGEGVLAGFSDLIIIAKENVLFVVFFCSHCRISFIYGAENPAPMLLLFLVQFSKASTKSIFIKIISPVPSPHQSEQCVRNSPILSIIESFL